MNLTEALATGKAIKRALEEDYMDFDSYVEEYSLSKEAALATDWEVEPDAASLTAAKFAEAWNAARVGTTNIRAAGETDFYKRLSAQLFSR